MTQVKRATHTIDATGKAPGRLAGDIVRLLQGKHRADYVANKDMGDKVVVEHVGRMVFSGRKLDQKLYRRHSGYPGGLKEVSAKELMEKKPGDILRAAVKRMLPKNRLQADRLKRLKIR